MAESDRVRDARLEVQRAALRRWAERQDARAANERKVSREGPGAADSPQRNARLLAREAAFAQARELRQRGLLPLGLERKMGPTLDYTPFAPSDAARTAGRPVARIVGLGGPGTQPEGFATGFLVGAGLLLTNHHVFPDRSYAVGTAANFLHERTDRGIELGTLFGLDPDRFFLSDERLDFALVAVAPRSGDGRPLDGLGLVALVEATPKILVGQPVNIVQHPEGGPKQYATAQNRLLDILDSGFLHYETDTLQGSSGSPVFSANWELVALHHTAIPEVREGRVLSRTGGFWEPGMPDDQVRWIANEGIRVSAIVKRLGEARLDDPGQQAMLRELLAGTTDPADDITRRLLGPGGGTQAGPVPATRPGGGDTMAHNQFVFTGPVTIHVHAAPAAAAAARPGDAPVALAPPAAVGTLPAAPEASIRFDRNYRDREGYDPGFLCPDAAEGPRLLVPVPGISDDRMPEVLTDGDGKPLVLKYHHFELVMNRVRRLQMWSAVNVDYDPARKTKREGGRDAFGSDRWIPDPRIPAELQIMDAEFYKPAGNIDRGHVVRREDNAWGDGETEIEFANSDTFHWTNCTPQHEAFNQSAPGRNDATYRGMKGIWGDFENHIQASLKGGETRACILAGPILDNENDPEADFGSGPVRYPLRFWKVVVVPVAVRGRRALRAFGFVFSQKPVVDRFGIEAFGPAKFKRYQASLESIQALAGLVFAEGLHEADAMAGGPDGIRVESLDQVRGIPGREPRAAAAAEPTV